MNYREFSGGHNPEKWCKVLFYLELEKVLISTRKSQFIVLKTIKKILEDAKSENKRSTLLVSFVSGVPSVKFDRGNVVVELIVRQHKEVQYL